MTYLSGAPGPLENLWSPKRVELLNWFRAYAPSLAPSYEGAVRIISDPAFPGRVHFIAHAVRDIADRLVFVIDPQKSPPRVQYEEELDRIVKEWPVLDALLGDQDPTSVEITLPRPVVLKIDGLVNQHRKRRARGSQYKQLFGCLMRTANPNADVSERIVKGFSSVRKWFMDNTHLRAKPPNVDELELQRNFNAFEGILHSFVGNFFTGTGELDAILQQANR